VYPGSTPRHFNDYLAPLTIENLDAGAPYVSPPQNTNTVTTMMESIKRSGNVDLAIHLLRITLRDTALVRQVWMAQLKDGMARLEASDANDLKETATASAVQLGTQSTAEVLQTTPDVAQDTPEAVQATPTLPPTPEPARIALPERRLLVSAQWFEAVHLLARSGSDTIWAAQEIRRLMDIELQYLSEEHLILTGLNIEDSIDDISPTAPVYSISTGNDNRLFNPARYLRNLRKTFWELSKMSTVSLQQQERRRIATKAKNARRYERQAEAMKLEQEKVEAKQALRKRRDEIQEVPFALA